MTKKNCNSCNKNKCPSCAECQAKAFELEVDEEIQQERLTRFWKKYSWLIYSAVFLILAGTLGFETYNSWKTNTRLKESDLFEKSMLLNINGHNQDAMQGFEELAQNGKSGYKTLAQLELADILMLQGEKEKAIQTIEQLIQQTNQNDPLHQVGVLTLVSYQIEDGDSQELLNRLKPLLQDQHFQALATELSVILLKKQNETKQADDLIQKALENPKITPNIKARLSALKSEE